jgi:ABC-2 type transport system ATP-binding protein
MQENTFLRLEAVTKRFDQHLAVDNVSLSIPRGSVYGLLGPNGAGKTTIIRMITGIMYPDSGRIRFDGDLLKHSHTNRVGYMPEERGLYKKTKVREQILYLLALKGMKPAAARQQTDSWLEKLGLSEWANRNVGDLSKGMQQKVQFISTVAHEPDLLILDEPFSGLDPVNTRVLEKEIHRMQANGTTIIFSTHRMEQVEELCNYIALINKGNVILEDQIQTVRQQFRKNIYHLEFSGPAEWLDTVPGIEILSRNHSSVMLRPLAEGGDRSLLALLAESPLSVLKFELHLPRLNEIFIELVQDKSQLPTQAETTA